MKDFKLSRAVIFFAVLAFVFGKSFAKDLGRLAFETTVPATIIARTESCRLVTRDDRGKRVRKRMPCDEAFAARRTDPSRKARVYRRTYVTVAFLLDNGQRHTTRVRDTNINARSKAVGDEVMIAFDPEQPNRVFTPISTSQIVRSGLIFLFGVVALIITLGSRRIFDWLMAILRRRATQPKSRRKPMTVGLPNRDAAKPTPAPAPLPTQRVRKPKFKQTADQRPNVVSRRRGWFHFAG